MRRIIGITTAVAAALLLVGVAWASGNDPGDGSTTSLGDDGSSTSDLTPATSITVGSTTSTGDGSTSTSNPGGKGTTTSTSTPRSSSTTSTSIDDHGGSTTSTSIDDHEDPVIADTEATYVVPGVGTVSIAVTGGALVLVEVDAGEWTVDVEKERADRIEIEFRSGSEKAEFEIEIDDGRLDVEIESESA